MIKILLLITLLVILFIYIYSTRSIENYDSSVTVLNTSSLIQHLKTTRTTPLLTTNSDNSIIHITNIPDTFNNVTTLNLQNNNLSMLDYKSTLSNLPSLQLFDISNNNNFIGFQENSFSDNNSLQRIVINQPSFYIDSGRKLFISIDSNNLPNLNKNSIHNALGISNNVVISYYNPSNTNQTTSSLSQGQGQGQTTSSLSQGQEQGQTTSSLSQRQGQGQTTSSLSQGQTTSSLSQGQGQGQGQTTSSLSQGQGQTTSSLSQGQGQTTSSLSQGQGQGQGQTTSSLSQEQGQGQGQGQTTSSLSQGQGQTTSSLSQGQNIDTDTVTGLETGLLMNQTTSSQDVGSYIPNCSSFAQRDPCNNQNHCVFNVNTNICNNVCTGVQANQCGSTDDTRNICRVNCGLCEIDDGNPTRSVCSVTDCNDFNNDISNCPDSVCNAIVSEAGNICYPKPCTDLSEESCELMRNIDGSPRCFYDSTTNTCNMISGFKNYEHFQSSQYTDLNDDEYLQIFQFVRKSDLINGINLNINKCVSESNCDNNNECISYENNCKSCYQILEDYYSTFYYYNYYNNQGNNIDPNSPNIDDLNRRREFINLRDNELRERRLLLEQLISKNILDSNGDLVNQSLDNLDVNDNCYELKKLLTQNNITCTTVQNNLGNFVENCTSNIQGCTTRNFNCRINNDLQNNSINYCLPYNMSSNKLELNHKQNKMINMLRKYPVSDCYDNFIFDSKL